MLHTAVTYLRLPGATAFESLGPNAPAGMIRRLNIVAQRRGHNDDNSPAIADGAMTQIQDASSVSHAETVVRLVNGPRAGNKETRTARRHNGYPSSVDIPNGTGGAMERIMTNGGDGGTSESGSPGTDDLSGTWRRSARVPGGTDSSGHHGGR